MSQRNAAVKLCESLPLSKFLLQAENRLCHQMQIIEYPDDYTAELKPILCMILSFFFSPPQISIICYGGQN